MLLTEHVTIEGWGHPSQAVVQCACEAHDGDVSPDLGWNAVTKVEDGRRARRRQRVPGRNLWWALEGGEAINWRSIGNSYGAVERVGAVHWRRRGAFFLRGGGEAMGALGVSMKIGGGSEGRESFL